VDRETRGLEGAGMLMVFYFLAGLILVISVALVTVGIYEFVIGRQGIESVNTEGQKLHLRHLDYINSK